MAAPTRAVRDNVWRAQDTTPGEIEAAIRGLLVERYAEHAGYAPARALNLVCVVDREWSGEIANRLRRVGRSLASRTVVCSVEPGRTTLDAVATIASEDPGPGAFALLRETIIVSCGEEHLPHLDGVVGPLVATDIPTVVWSPHGHPEAVDALLALAQVVLLDSGDESDPRDALRRVDELLGRGHVVDLAWLRSAPWRERVAAAFDPPARRGELATLSRVTVHMREGSDVAALLVLGWLCDRLGWRPGPLTRHGTGWRGRARARRGEVELSLQATGDLPVPGLAGIELETAEGTALTLNRGTGGLAARRRERDGREAQWTVLGASRGEPGILGEGLRQALMRDGVYAGALRAARALV